MTDVLTVPTHFGDLAELSTGLIDRVDDGRLILYGPTMFAQGAHVGFRVLLSDESTALEGFGLVTEVYDGGEGREPEIRYDTVLESLELDGRNEVVFERIVLARQSLAGDAPATGEVDISDIDDADAVSFASEAPTAAFDEPMEFPAADAGVTPEGDFADAVDFAAPEFEVADVEAAAAPGDIEASADIEAPADIEASVDIEASADIEASVEPVDVEAPIEVETPEFEDVGDDAFDSLPPAAELVAPPIDVAPPRIALGVTDGVLVRPIFAASWWPRAEAPEPRPSSGWFQYATGTLPTPPQAPRPELSPELRVAPAPRPGAEAAPPSVEAAVVEAAPLEAALAEESLAEVVEHDDVAGEIEATGDIEVAGDIEAMDDASVEENATQAMSASEFGEMPLPDGDAEIAPAVEAEYVSVGDANPDVAPAESSEDVGVDEAAPADSAADDAVDVDVDI